MAERTEIGWTDGTINGWWGCTKVSRGCKFCYAEVLSDKRYKHQAFGPGGTRRIIKGWRASIRKLSKLAYSEERRVYAFVSSMSDIFEWHDTMGGVNSDNWKNTSRVRVEIFAEIVRHPEIDFQVLTKRPHIAAAMLSDVTFWLSIDGQLKAWGHPGLPFTPKELSTGERVLVNLWMGTSVENDAQAALRIPWLLKCHAALWFLSCEPLVGRLDLTPFLWGRLVDCKNCPKDADCECGWKTTKANGDRHIGWIIAGGESGAGCQPMHPDYIRTIRDDCKNAGVPFFFKQWGNWVPATNICDGIIGKNKEFYHEDGTLMLRVSNPRHKTIDGKEHLEFPVVEP